MQVTPFIALGYFLLILVQGLRKRRIECRVYRGRSRPIFVVRERFADSTQVDVLVVYVRLSDVGCPGSNTRLIP